MIPQINGMNVVGLVSIPGMMTGQILGGASPLKAAKYQLVITFLISGCTFTSVCVVTCLTIRAFFDERGRHHVEQVGKQTAPKIAQCCDPKVWWGGGAEEVSPSGDGGEQLLGGDPAGAGLVLRPQGTLAGQGAEGAEVVSFDLEGKVAGRPLGLRLSLRQGEVACVIGPSGVGKSTALRWLCDLRACAGGAMALRGRSSGSMSPQAWRREVLYVHQSKVALPGTPRDLARLVDRLGVSRGRPALDPAPCLEAFGLDACLLDRPWGELSGGESQRAMLALAVFRGNPLSN